MMTSRERIFTAMDHRTPDRCPADFWGTREVQNRLKAYFGITTEDELLDALQSDMQAVHAKSTRKTITFDDGSYTDNKGVRVKAVSNEFNTYQERMEAPLAGAQCVADLEAYDLWPNADDFQWETFAAEIKPFWEKRCTRFFTGGIFETAIALRGYEQFMMDMALQPEIPHYIMKRITDYLIGMVDNAEKCGAGKYIDFIYTYDDIATQNSLMVSPQMLEEFVYPCHRRYNAHIKQNYHKPILFHSCGAIRPEIAKLRDLPIDVLNPLQPLAGDMDFAAIKAEFGDSLTFHGGICIQETLPHGTPDDVRRAVRYAIETLGKNGGYILAPAHSMQNDTPTENILALFEPELRYC